MLIEYFYSHKSSPLYLITRSATVAAMEESVSTWSMRTPKTDSVGRVLPVYIVVIWSCDPLTVVLYGHVIYLQWSLMVTWPTYSGPIRSCDLLTVVPYGHMTNLQWSLVARLTCTCPSHRITATVVPTLTLEITAEAKRTMWTSILAVVAMETWGKYKYLRYYIVQNYIWGRSCIQYVLKLSIIHCHDCPRWENVCLKLEENKHLTFLSGVFVHTNFAPCIYI